MAAQSSRSSRTPRRPAPPATGTSSRVAVIAMAVLCVTAIAACAILLSYNGIFQIALRGGVTGWAAHLYPGMFILLLLMAFWAIYLLRDAPRRRRIWVDLLVLAMILAAAGASALHSLHYELVEWAATLVVAGGPWLALLISFRLLLWIVAQVRGERVAVAGEPAAEEPAAGPAPDSPAAPAVEEEPVAVDSGSPAEPPTEPLAVLPRTETSPAATAAPSSSEETAPLVSSTPAPRPAAADISAEADLGDDTVRPAPAEQSTAPPEPDRAADERGSLPKRVPPAEGSAIRRAADPSDRPPAAVADEPAELSAGSAVDAELDDADWESITDAEDDWETGDTPLADDPSEDETHSEPAEVAAAPQAAPRSSAAGAPHPVSREEAAADDAASVPEQSPPPAPRLRRRPIVLRPRRSSPPPLRPPSSEVRSSPTPPEE
ncbi:hypothetical protein [Thermobifida fusca]|uniref:hypothetical protein n=1 Tax=Thermobifida fusca TaxID=2021 RepID=UPI001F44E9B7|nr:hypothetical protein [Thermobifida fusca]